jgi:hypothetical protein
MADDDLLGVARSFSRRDVGSLGVDDAGGHETDGADEQRRCEPYRFENATAVHCDAPVNSDAESAQ